MKGMIVALAILLLSGCQTMTGQGHDVRPLEFADEAVIDQTVADKAKEIVLSMDEVIEIKGVTVGEEIVLAPRVKHFSRFRLNDIRKKAHERVKKRYPHATVHISTDGKIFMEVERLERELTKKTISEKRLKTELKKLDEMMKG